MPPQLELDTKLYQEIEWTYKPRQTVVKQPQLIGETCEITIEYERHIRGLKEFPRLEQEVIQAPIKNQKQYVTDLLAWFSAEECAIESLPLNDRGTKNKYRAEIRVLTRILTKEEVADQAEIQIRKRLADNKKREQEKARQLLAETKQILKDVSGKWTSPKIKFGKWTVQKNTFEEYKNAVEEMREAYTKPFDDGENMPRLTDPVQQLQTFQNRVKLHKQLFKQAGVPYHDSDKATEDSMELYRLIESKIEKNF